MLHIRPFAASFLSVTYLLGVVPSGWAFNYTVNSTADRPDAAPGSGGCATAAPVVCTLRAAIQEANESNANDTISLPPGIYKLTIQGRDEEHTVTGDLDVGTSVDGTKTSALTISRSGSTGTVIIDADGIDRIFDVFNAKLTLNDITLRNGYALESTKGFSGDGGAILSDTALELNNVVLTGNTATYEGGAISNLWALDNPGVITLTDVAVDGNGLPPDAQLDAPRFGGGIYSEGTATLTRVTLSGNRAGTGGAIFSFGDLTMTNCTVSGNTADDGAGIADNGDSADIRFVTIADNTNSPGGGALRSFNAPTLTHTIISNTPASEACSGFGFVSGGYNLDVGTSCGLASATDLQNMDPLLMPLQNYGGFTRTHALTPGSPAIDGGALTCLTTSDQRNLPAVVRPIDGNTDGVARCDIGSFEVTTSTSTSTSSTTTTSTSTSSTTTTSNTMPSSTSTSTSSTTTTSNTMVTTSTSTSTSSSTTSSTSTSSTTTTSTSTSTSTTTSTSTSSTTSTSTTTSSSTSSSSSTTTPTSSTTSTTEPQVSVCGNGIVDDGETCGEPTLPACENGLLCVECACRQLGDCQNNGNGVDLFDVIEKIDLVLQRHQPTAAQLVLCDDDCNMTIDLFDILNEIDVVLGVTTPPLVCAP